MITEKDIWNLKHRAKDLAMMLSDEDLERLIVELVEVKMDRDNHQGWP